VINLSLGHPVTESAATDPLCQAVARAASAGLIVVASAGNNGVTADGRQILGGIMSPGNSPYAITVGATNTHGTPNRADDTVATYSSRGPAPIDMTVKPDLAAPGNKIVSLEADGALLSTEYPSLHRAGNTTNAYMQLSGTSMAAPMVSGATALLLQGAPSLTAAQIKVLLQGGATYMSDGGLMGAGAGNANFFASRKLAANGVTQLTTTLLGGVVVPATGPIFFDAGTLSDRVYHRTGLRLLSVLDLTRALQQPSLLAVGDLNLLGLQNPLASLPANQLIWGQIAGWTGSQQILWGTTIYNPQGQQILWGTGTTGGTQILWGTGLVASDPE
jgi:serine protease AprX